MFKLTSSVTMAAKSSASVFTGRAEVNLMRRSVLIPNDSVMSSYSMVWVQLRHVLKLFLEEENENLVIHGWRL